FRPYRGRPGSGPEPERTTAGGGSEPGHCPQERPCRSCAARRGCRGNRARHRRGMSLRLPRLLNPPISTEAIMSDLLDIAGKTYSSRLLIGTGKYKDFEE